MTAKKRFLAFFFSVLMIWQGFFWAKAEGVNPLVLAEDAQGGTKIEEIVNEEAGRKVSPDIADVGHEVIPDIAEAAREVLPDITEVEDAGVTLEESNAQVGRKDRLTLYEEPAVFSKGLVNGKIQKVEDTDGIVHYILEYVIRFNGKKWDGELTENSTLYLEDSLKSDMLRYFDPNLNLHYSLSDWEKYKPSFRKGVWRSGKLKTDASGAELFEAAEDDEEHRGPVYDLLENPDAENEDFRLDYRDWEADTRSISKYLLHFSKGEGFELRYFVEIKELPLKGAQYENVAELRDEDRAFGTSEVRYTVTENGGSFENEGFSISIKKTDKESGKPLEAAKFLISAKHSPFQREITTNQEGLAKLDKLLQDDYEIREMEAPEGYIWDETVYEIKKEEFKDKREVVVELQNTSKNSELRDIIVEKKWIVKPGWPSPATPPTMASTEDREDAFLNTAERENRNGEEEAERVAEEEDAVNSEEENESPFRRDDPYYHGSLLELNEEGTDFTTEKDESVPLDEESEILKNIPLANPDVLVHLYKTDKNGVKTEVATATLSYHENNPKENYRHVFKNLPRRDEDGNEIPYSIEEDEVEDYNMVCTGTADTKFTLTNYSKKGQFRAIPVTKIWKGKGPHPKSLTVYLYADGKKVKKIVLNERNSWQHTFVVPRVDDKNHYKLIRYGVREEEVEGYESVKEDFEHGFKNVFINTKTATTPAEDDSNLGNGSETEASPTGGNRPNPSNGGSTPRVVTTTISGTNPPAITEETPGEVLGAERASTASEEGAEGQVLGAEREPKAMSTKNTSRVLGAGRGRTKTSDSSAVKLYLVFFLLSTLSFSLVLFSEKKRFCE